MSLFQTLCAFTMISEFGTGILRNTKVKHMNKLTTVA